MSRQTDILDWVKRTFGQQTLTKEERYRRFIEEAVELGQALDIPSQDIIRIVEVVYSKPKGIISQEIGGVGLTLEALCAFLHFSLYYETEYEFNRVLSISKEHFRERHNKKADLSIGEYCDPDSNKEN